MWMSMGRSLDPDEVARRLGAIAVEAGQLLAGAADRMSGHRTKEDGSPSTEADLASERLILDRLAESWPDIPAVAEESAPGGVAAGLFFLVDPLDGTRDYVTGSGEYSVNIALVGGRRPLAAALAAPANGRVWIAGKTAHEASTDRQADLAWRPISARSVPRPGGFVALGSRRHGDPASEACLAALPIGQRRTVSSAVKFGLVACGEADLYIRCGATMEWDTAAGDHLVTCAGGAVLGPDRRPLAYGHGERRYVNGPFVAVGDPSLAERIRLPEACA